MSFRMDWTPQTRETFQSTVHEPCCISCDHSDPNTFAVLMLHQSFFKRGENLDSRFSFVTCFYLKARNIFGCSVCHMHITNFFKIFSICKFCKAMLSTEQGWANCFCQSETNLYIVSSSKSQQIPPFSPVSFRPLDSFLYLKENPDSKLFWAD